MKTGDKAFINAPGRLLGCPVVLGEMDREKQEGPTGDHSRVWYVHLLETRGQNFAGERMRYLQRDLLPALEPGQRVMYSQDYLRANGADDREYGRVARVLKRLEGTLVQLEWDDRLGPSTMATDALEPLEHALAGAPWAGGGHAGT